MRCDGGSSATPSRALRLGLCRAGGCIDACRRDVGEERATLGRDSEQPDMGRPGRRHLPHGRSAGLTNPGHGPADRQDLQTISIIEKILRNELHAGDAIQLGEKLLLVDLVGPFDPYMVWRLQVGLHTLYQFPYEQL